MKIRTRAPLRLGLAGGGTDVSPFSELHGGCVLNTTIQMYAYCTLETTNDNNIIFDAKDINTYQEYSSVEHLEFSGELDLFKGIYNRIVKDYPNKPLSFKLTTYSDAVHGSGLGGSSTMVVAIIKAFVEWLKLPLGDYDIAHLAYEIERIDVGLSGGKQDHYAATFGGFNYIEFFNDDRVIVNPLRIKNWIINELEVSTLLYFTSISRESSNIIEEQSKNAKFKNTKSIKAMHQIKESTFKMKESLLIGDIKKFAETFDLTWNWKKETAHSITNETIEIAYHTAKKNGAYAGKVSGAGGGGFMIFIIDPIKKISLKKALEKLGGKTYDIKFTKEGTQAWTV